LDGVKKFPVLLVSKTEIKIEISVPFFYFKDSLVTLDSILIHFAVEVGTRQVVVGIDEGGFCLNCVLKSIKSPLKLVCHIVSIAEIVAESGVSR